MVTIECAFLGVKSGDSVLDVGCGSGRHSQDICESGGLVYALDINEESLRRTHSLLQGKCVVVMGDITNLPFKDSSFDKIVCSEVLEHVVDDEQGIREMVRVLKNDGILAVSIPSYLSEIICWKLSKEYHGGVGDHIRMYKTNEIVAKLKQNGLSVYAIRHKQALYSIYWILRCLFGVNNKSALIPSLYHRFLMWNIRTKSRLIRQIENLLNHFFPKSIVLYLKLDVERKT